MTQAFIPTGPVYAIDSSQMGTWIYMPQGDYPDSVMITNTDTGNAAAVVVETDTVTYNTWPTVGSAGAGIIVQPSSSVLLAVNPIFAATVSNPIRIVAQCDIGETATIIINSGALQ